MTITSIGKTFKLSFKGNIYHIKSFSATFKPDKLQVECITKSNEKWVYEKELNSDNINTEKHSIALSNALNKMLLRSENIITPLEKLDYQLTRSIKGKFKYQDVSEIGIYKFYKLKEV